MKKRLLLAVAVMAFGVSLSATVFAHHAFTSEYDINKKVTLTGTIVQMRWINPHSWLTINVTQPDGTAATWELEFANPNQLLHRGWRKNDLPVGATVTVDGWQARNGSRTANARTVQFADGRRLFASGPESPQQ